MFRFLPRHVPIHQVRNFSSRCSRIDSEARHNDGHGVKSCLSQFMGFPLFGAEDFHGVEPRGAVCWQKRSGERGNEQYAQAYCDRYRISGAGFVK